MAKRKGVTRRKAVVTADDGDTKVEVTIVATFQRGVLVQSERYRLMNRLAGKIMLAVHENDYLRVSLPHIKVKM